MWGPSWLQRHMGSCGLFQVHHLCRSGHGEPMYSLPAAPLLEEPEAASAWVMPKLSSSGPRVDPLAALCNEVSKLVLSWRRVLNAGLLQFLFLVLRACTEIVLSPPPWHAL